MKIGEVSQVYNDSSGQQKYAIVKVSLRTGKLDRNGFEKYRAAFLLRNLDSLSKPIITAAQRKRQQRDNKCIDLDAVLWSRFMSFVREQDPNITLDKSVHQSYNRTEFTEPFPFFVKAPSQDIVKYDKDRGFKLNLSRQDWAEILSSENKWPAVSYTHLTLPTKA